MEDENPRELSRRLVRRYRRNEAAQDRNVRAELDPLAYARLDRITQRELGVADRERRLGELWGVRVGHKLLTVILTMRNSAAAAGRVDRGRRGWRREAVALQRRAGKMALGRLLPSLEAKPEVEVVASHWLTRSVVVRTGTDYLPELADRSDIASIAHNKPMIVIALNMSRPKIRADQVESGLGFTGKGCDVAVLDTGVDFTHAALVAPAGNQFDFTGEGLGDLHGHGTHCAGVVASNGQYRGVAPGCTVHDYKLMDAEASADANNCIAAIQQAVTDQMDVLSNSWGFSHVNGAWTCPNGTCVLCIAANNAVAAGTVFVVAAGNEDNNPAAQCSSYDTHIRCPGHATDAVTVAASDDNDVMASFSSIGPAADGRAKPDVTAPGVAIVSARSTTGSDMNGQAPVIGTDWLESSGTSMACPHVAGVAALMIGKNPNLAPAQVKSVLMSTAINIGATADEMGAGRVDALDAVNAV